MAASDMMSALMELCQEKHIDQLYLIDRLEQSLAKSYAEILHLEWGAKVTIDRTTGKIYVYRLEPIDDSMDEEGNFTEFEEIDVTPKNTSRIAAQHDDGYYAERCDYTLYNNADMDSFRNDCRQLFKEMFSNG